MLGNSLAAELLAAPQEGLSSMDLAGYDITLCKPDTEEVNWNDQRKNGSSICDEDILSGVTYRHEWSFTLRNCYRPCHSSGGQSPTSNRGGPGSIPGQVMCDLWWKKWRWGRFSSGIWISPANSHSTDLSTLITIYHPGLVQ
jgi:hypothetical protein